MASFCQHCGASHDDEARFCPKCGRSLVTTVTAPTSYAEKYAGTPYAAMPSQTVAAPPSRTSSRRPVVISLLVAIVAFVAIGAWQLGLLSRLSSTAGTAGNIPPSGQIWFGSSFDTTTFALSGITTSTRTGSTVALVALLPRSVSTGNVTMRVSLNGTQVVNQAVTMTGTGDLFGTTVGPFVVPGEYKYELADIGGNALASGTLTVSQ